MMKLTSCMYCSVLMGDPAALLPVLRFTLTGGNPNTDSATRYTSVIPGMSPRVYKYWLDAGLLSPSEDGSSDAQVVQCAIEAVR